MDELKILVDMVAGLPQMAIWVLLGFLFYKLAVLGSLYGLIRFGIDKLHDVIVNWNRRPSLLTEKELEGRLDGLCITGVAPQVIEQLRRVRGKGVGIDTPYLHRQSVEWLATAIDNQIEADKTRKAA